MNEFKPISDYRIVGDLYSAALVSSSGSIDWLCLPNFDSPSIFAAILDNQRGGSFSLITDEYNTSCEYMEETAIAETVCEHKNSDEEFVLHDFMLPQPTTPCKNHVLTRRMKARSGEPNITFIFDPQPDYARSDFDGTYNPDQQIISGQLNGNELTLFLPENSEVAEEADGWHIRIDMKAEQQVQMTLEYGSDETVPCHTDHALLDETKAFWRKWIQRGTYLDFCKQMMKRSAITLKLLQHLPSGGLIAAPTTSLPEEIGGERNWDYRFVWTRDATYTLYSLMVLDLQEEARSFFSYIEDILLQSEVEDGIRELSHLYSLGGESVEVEKTLKHLNGYRDSTPIRIGNSASDQFQLDSYGVMIDAFYLAHKRGVELSESHITIVCDLVERINAQWDTKDKGIWEVRAEPQHYTYSKVMCWVGVDRALRMQDTLGFNKEKRKQLRKLRETIKEWIWEHCFSKELGAFRQHPQVEAHDATTFLFPLVQFLDKDNPQTKKIIQNVRSALCHDGIFAYRYKTDDGLEGEEGAFLLCSFWMISALAKVGETSQAKRLFHQIENHMAESGLMAEEFDPETEEYLGNFPQGFSHMGYIMSAYYIDRYTNE